MQKIILIALLLYCFTSTAQIFNYVPNSGFEEHYRCPIGLDGLDRYYWGNYSQDILEYWYQPSNGTTDYFHECSNYDMGVPDNFFGYQEAKEGKAYIGLLAYHVRYEYPDSFVYREYAHTKLLKPLEADKTYCVSFYAALDRDSILSNEVSTIYATKSLGINISKTLDTFYTPLKYGLIPVIPPLEPQIEATEYLEEYGKWYLIRGLYKAKGGEQYITIGNFRNNEETLAMSKILHYGDTLLESHEYVSYYFIDKVTIYEENANLLFAEKNIQLCIDSLPKQIKSSSILDSYQWSTGQTSAAVTVTGAGKYSVVGSIEGCPVVDTIEVTVDEPLTVDIGEERIVNCKFGITTPIILRNNGPLPQYAWSINYPIYESMADSFVVTKPNTYRLFSKNTCGSYYDEVLIVGCPESGIYVPNVFKPDAIGENANFMPSGWSWVFENLQVFDAWGHQVYSETNPTRGWDGYIEGKKANIGVYVWILTYHGIYDDKILKKYGDVTVVW
jgi:hypothetical protein